MCRQLPVGQIASDGAIGMPRPTPDFSGKAGCPSPAVHTENNSYPWIGGGAHWRRADASNIFLGFGENLL